MGEGFWKGGRKQHFVFKFFAVKTMAAIILMQELKKSGTYTDGGFDLIKTIIMSVKTKSECGMLVPG